MKTFCMNGGLLVGPQHPRTRESQAYLGGPPAGCTRLGCARCGQVVRSVDGWAMHADTTDDKRRIAQLMVAFIAEWAALTHRPDFAGVFERNAAFRCYLCECGTLNIDGVEELHSPDHRAEPTVPWVCSGHLASD